MVAIMLDVGDDTLTLLNLPHGVRLYPAPGNACAWLATVDGVVADGVFVAYARHPHPGHPEARWSCESPGVSRFYRAPGSAVRALVRFARAAREE